MLTKSNSTIYSTFKKGKQDSFADILKSTKSIIRNSSSFNKYINHYTSSIQISAFKSPDRSVYPILKNNNIIPLQKATYGVNDDSAQCKSRSVNHHHNHNSNNPPINDSIEPHSKQLVKGTFPLFKLKFPEISKVFEDHNGSSTNEDRRYFNHNTKTTRRHKRNHNQLNKSSSALNLLMKGIKCNISYFIRSNQNMLHIQNSTLQAFQINKRDILIQDFMSKWKHYKDLQCYDENEIFHTNTAHYDELIQRKMRLLTQDEASPKVENPTTVLESTFEDANMNQIYLRLTSMQIAFTPILSKRCVSARRKKIVMKFPFAYMFLFYYDDIEFFKYVLMNVVSFKKDDYTEVEFDESRMCEFLKRNFSTMTTPHDANANTDDTLLSSHCHHRHQQPSSSSSPRKSVSSLLPFRKNVFHKVKRGSTSYMNNNNNSILNLSSLVEPKIKHHTKRTLVHNSERSYKKFFYNKYAFTWLTPKVNYNVVITMPHVYFEYENCKNPILRYIEKELMMYLYERNFMNWDYYIMCYLFSIKRFRVFIENINSKCGVSDTTLDTNNVFSRHTFLEKNEYDDSVIQLSPAKKFQFNLKHTRCFFFSSNDLRSTCIVNVTAYALLIDNDKLNPYTNWKFNLNFGETNFLNNVSLYETLELFLMKIIKTDSSCGKLTLDFTVFTDFDASVLNYKRYYYTRRAPRKEGGQTDIRQSTAIAGVIDVDESNRNDVYLEIVCPGVEVECVGFAGLKNVQRFRLDVEMLREMAKMSFKEWPVYVWTHREKWVDVEIEESGEKTNKAGSWRNRQMKTKDGVVSPMNHRGSNFKSFEHAKMAFIAENSK